MDDADGPGPLFIYGACALGFLWAAIGAYRRARQGRMREAKEAFRFAGAALIVAAIYGAILGVDALLQSVSWLRMIANLPLIYLAMFAIPLAFLASWRVPTDWLDRLRREPEKSCPKCGDGMEPGAARTWWVCRSCRLRVDA